MRRLRPSYTVLGPAVTLLDTKRWLARHVSSLCAEAALAAAESASSPVGQIDALSGLVDAEARAPTGFTAPVGALPQAGRSKPTLPFTVLSAGPTSPTCYPLLHTGAALAAKALLGPVGKARALLWGMDLASSGRHPAGLATPSRAVTQA